MALDGLLTGVVAGQGELYIAFEMLQKGGVSSNRRKFRRACEPCRGPLTSPREAK